MRLRVLAKFRSKIAGTLSIIGRRGGGRGYGREYIQLDLKAALSVTHSLSCRVKPLCDLLQFLNYYRGSALIIIA